MGIKKALKGLKEEAECQLWTLEDSLKETWNNIRHSSKAKGAAAMGIPAIAFAYWLAPKLGYTQEADEQQFLCGLPENTSADLRNKVLELMQRGKLLMLNVKAGETITQAIEGYASSNGGPTQRKFIDEETMFLTTLGYNLNLTYPQQCDVPICTSLYGCNPEQLLETARAGPPTVVAEETAPATPEARITPPAAPENHNPTVSAGADLEGRVGRRISIKAEGADQDNDVLKYKWEIVSQPDGSALDLDGAETPTISFRPGKPGDYTLRVTANDGRGGAAADDVNINVKATGLDLMHGMNPAAIFDTGLGINLGTKGGELKPYMYHVEGGPIFGIAKRTDRDTINVTDPATGDPIATIALSKILETDTSGYYAKAFAKIGGMTLIYMDFTNTAENGHFTISGPQGAPGDGSGQADYERNDLSFRLGVRRGLYSVPGKFLLAGDLFLGYMETSDSGRDQSGTNDSDAGMFGGGAGLNLAFSLNKNDFSAVPGLGLAYHYYSGSGDDLHTLLVTKAGVYDIKWSEFFAASLSYNFSLQNDGISDKMLESVLELHKAGLEVVFGKGRNLGLGIEYIISGRYNEDIEGGLLDRSGDVTGWDASLNARLPLPGTRMNLGLRGAYGQRRTDFGDEGNREESIGSVGGFIEF